MYGGLITVIVRKSSPSRAECLFATALPRQHTLPNLVRAPNGWKALAIRFVSKGIDIEVTIDLGVMKEEFLRRTCCFYGL